MNPRSYLLTKVFVILLIYITSTSCSIFNKRKQEEPKPIAFSDLRVQGELLTRLLKNFNRLEESKYQPDSVFLSEEESGWWPGDKEGRTVLGLVMDAQATHRSPVYLDSIIHLFPKKMNAKGYFGTNHTSGEADEQQLSSHGWVLRGLCEYYLWKKDPAVLKMINTIIDNLVIPTKGLHAQYPIDPDKRTHNGAFSGNRMAQKTGHWILSSDIGCDFIFMDGVVQSYQVTQRPELKGIIDEMATKFLQMDLLKLKAQTHATLTALRGLLRYYEITKDTSLITSVESRYILYKKNAMTENYENYNWFGRPQWTEPCAFIDSYIVSVWLWRITGKPEYLEDAQHIYYNAIGMGQRSNGGFGCDNCSGAENCFLHVELDEASWCCTMRGGEGLSCAAENMVYTLHNIIYFTTFDNAVIKVGIGNDSIILEETTNYPFVGKINFDVIDNNLPLKPELRFFMPRWITDPIITINGNKVNYEIKAGFIAVSPELKKGDFIEISFKIKSGEEKTENLNSVKSTHKYYFGPLIIGYIDKNEVSLPQHLEFEPITRELFKAKGKPGMFIPVHHMMNTEVKKETGYRLQILFKD